MSANTERDALRQKIMDRMSPLVPPTFHEWHNWPGTWCFAEAALQAIDAASLPIPPEGWKLVPIEPTVEMWDQAENASMECDWLIEAKKERGHGAFEFPTMRIWQHVCAYRAMLQASPAPPPSQVVVQPKAVIGVNNTSEKYGIRPDGTIYPLVQPTAGDCGNANCGWRGPISECSYVGTVGPCCPECREIVEPDAAQHTEEPKYEVPETGECKP